VIRYRRPRLLLERSGLRGSAGADGLRLGGRRRGCFGSGRGRVDLPVAAFLEAGAEIAVLGALLDDERRAALRARLGDWLVGSSEVAIGIARAAVKNAAAPASFG